MKSAGSIFACDNPHLVAHSDTLEQLSMLLAMQKGSSRLPHLCARMHFVYYLFLV